MNDQDLTKIASQVGREAARSRRHWITIWVVITSTIIASTLAWVGAQQRDQIRKLKDVVTTQEQAVEAANEVLASLRAAQEREACQVLEHRIVATGSFRAILATLKGIALAAADDPGDQRLREFTTQIRLPPRVSHSMIRAYRRDCHDQPYFQNLPHGSFMPVSDATLREARREGELLAEQQEADERRRRDRDRDRDGSDPPRRPPQDPDPCRCPDIPDEVEDLFDMLPTPFGGFL